MQDIRSIIWGLFFVLVMVAWIAHGCRSGLDRFHENQQERREHREERWDQWRDDREQKRDDRQPWWRHRRGEGSQEIDVQ